MRVFRMFAGFALALAGAQHATACPTQAVVQTAPFVAVNSFAVPSVAVLAPATIAAPVIATPAVVLAPAVVVEQQIVRERHRPARVQVTRIRVRSR
jgi:hypothetical protein